MAKNNESKIQGFKADNDDYHKKMQNAVEKRRKAKRAERAEEALYADIDKLGASTAPISETPTNIRRTKMPAKDLINEKKVIEEIYKSSDSSEEPELHDMVSKITVVDPKSGLKQAQNFEYKDEV